MPDDKSVYPMYAGWSGIYPTGNRTVWEDDNPEIGRILGPDGRLIRIVRAKPERRVGFRPDRSQ